jgi:phospholipid transport system substrate-binding protein
MNRLPAPTLAEQSSAAPAPSRSFWRHLAGLAVVLALVAAPRPGAAVPASGGDIVQGLYESLIVTMKNGETLGQSGRYSQLAPVIRRTFDLPLMARLSVGPVWATLSEAQKQQVTDSYGRYISAVYAERFDSYHGQKLQVTGQDPAPAGVLVRSRIVKADGDPVRVDYLMHQSGDTWLIADIYLDGTISELATRRSEFASIIRNQGIDGLIEALNRKADMLTGTTARAD